MQCETNVMGNAPSVIVLASFVLRQKQSLCMQCVQILRVDAVDMGFVCTLWCLPTSRYILFGCSSYPVKEKQLIFPNVYLGFKIVYILLASSPRAFPPCCRDLCTVENKNGESLVRYMA